MTPFLLSQILAGVTLLIGMAAFQFRSRVAILRGWCVAAIVAAVHFYILGNVEACVLVLITASRFLIASFTTDKRLMYVFLILSVTGYALTYEDPVSLLALAATLIGTFGSFRKSETAVRVSMMSTEVLWAVHNYLVWSPVALGMEVLFFASNLIGLIRHRNAGTKPSGETGPDEPETNESAL